MALLIFTIFIGLFFVCTVFLSPVLRNYENRLQDLLQKKNLIVYNDYTINLGSAFFNIKLGILIIAVFTFLYTTQMLVFHIIILDKYKFFISMLIFGTFYLGVAIKTYIICLKVYKEKHIYIVDIIEIFMYSALLVLFCIFLDEILLYPGKTSQINKKKL